MLSTRYTISSVQKYLTANDIQFSPTSNKHHYSVFDCICLPWFVNYSPDLSGKNWRGELKSILRVLMRDTYRYCTLAPVSGVKIRFLFLTRGPKNENICGRHRRRRNEEEEG
jgi:hypothetical protein